MSYDSSAPSRTWNVSPTTLGNIQVGDQIRVDNVATSHKYLSYTVKSMTASTITVDDVMQGATAGVNTYNVYKVIMPLTEYSVETVQVGEDSYRYDIYFTGRHLTNVPALIATTLASGWRQYNGMRYGVSVETYEQGGSIGVQMLRMTAQDGPRLATDAVWKMVFNDRLRRKQIVVPNILNGGISRNGFTWGEDPVNIRNEIAIAIPDLANIQITRQGFGTPEEKYGYTYIFTFDDVNRFGFEEALFALGKGQLSSPLYVPVNSVSNNNTDFTNNVNDLTVSGDFNALSANNPDRNYFVRIRGNLTTGKDDLLNSILYNPTDAAVGIYNDVASTVNSGSYGAGARFTVVVTSGIDTSANELLNSLSSTSCSSCTPGIYTSIALVTSSGSGSGAKVSVTVTLGGSITITAIDVTTSGRGYLIGDVVIIPAGTLGTGSLAKSITLVSDDLNQALPRSVTSITVSQPGSKYEVGDILKISRTAIQSATNDLTIRLVNNDFTSNMFDWRWCPVNGGCLESTHHWRAVTSIIPGTYYELGGGSSVFVSFASSQHVLNDEWRFVAIGSSSASFYQLPIGAEFVTAVERSGDSPVKHLTIAPGFQGTDTGYVGAYKVAPVFTVQSQTTQVIKITTNPRSNANGVTFQVVNAGPNTNTQCLQWNAEEYTVESALRDPALGLCPTYSLKVTRDLATNAINAIVNNVAGCADGTYTNVNLVTASSPTSTGSGAKATVTVSGGKVSQAIVTLSGSGYAVGDGLIIPKAVLGCTVDRTFTLVSADLQAQSSGCVSVTRSVDSVNNAGGYVYSIYYEGKAFARVIDTSSLYVKAYVNDAVCGVSAVNMPGGTLSGKEIQVSFPAQSYVHSMFTRNALPLASSLDATIQVAYRGATVTQQKLYKSNGNAWAVTFASALGDVPSMLASPTSYLTAGTTVSVQDNVVHGEHPQSYDLTGLATGVDYSFRVSAYTRGTFHGYGPYSDTSVSTVAVPSNIPPALTGFAASETLQVSEVQNVIVGATHLREVQTVTTSATVYAEVQSITTSAENNVVIGGHFTMRFPEVQALQLTATNTANMIGYFKMRYQYYSDIIGTLSNCDSLCVPVTATAAEVEAALEHCSVIDSVSVTRSGYGGYTDYFGYTWSVSFIGNYVAGNVEQLTVSVFIDNACSSAHGAGVGPTASVTTLNENQAVGLNTEVHTLKLDASHVIAQGQYKIRLGTDAWSSACLEWNSTALQVQNALESLSYIDHVYVERFGNAASDDKYGSYGYTYSIYYTGNLMTAGNSITAGSGRTPFDTVNVQHGSAGGSNCLDFAYFDDGVLTNFAISSTGARFVGTTVRDTAFTLATTATTAPVLAAALKVMPTWVQVSDVRTTIADDQGGHTWTLVFDEAMGNVNQMVCGLDATANASPTICSQRTIIDGNYIDGYFVIGTSKLLSASASASDVQIALEALNGFGSIAVTRTGPTNQGGYTWTITWLDAIGDQAPLVFSNSLTGSGTSIVGETLQNGNYLSGTYQLEYQGKITGAIAYDATNVELAALLAPVVGSVSVSQSAVTTEGGSAYAVTFLALKGDVSPLVPHFADNLHGIGAVVKVLTTTQGALSSGSSLKISFDTPLHCSHSPVPSGECGASISSYSVEIGTSESNKNQVIPLSASYAVQHVRIAATDLYDSLIFDTDSASGYFRLAYNGAITGPINSAASATDVRDALESLPDINTVAVSRNFGADVLSGVVVATPGASALTCASTCDFNLAPGELIRIGGLWYKLAYSYAFSKTSFPLALATDASTSTTYGGDAMSAAPVYRWSRGYEWSVTFLSIAGNAPLPLGSPQHGLNPATASVSVRPNDCVNCAYISGLSAWTNYFLSARAQNGRGFGPYSNTQGVPKEVPGAPTYVQCASVSGSEIRVYFSPPTGDVSDVSQYTVEWDDNADFTHLSLCGSGICSTSSYGRDEITGAPLTVKPPFSYMIQSLSTGNTYYVRVAARNSISIANNNNIANTVWSDVVSSKTSNQSPSAPISVEVLLAGSSQMQVLISKPLTTGGSAILKYVIELCASSTFNDAATFRSIPVLVSDPALVLLQANGNKYTYSVSGLAVGKSYWVRVSAVNAIGAGPVTMISASLAIATKASAPFSAALTTATLQDTPITTAALTWTTPVANGGSPITGYVVEWWEAGSIPEIQVVSFTAPYPEFDATLPSILSSEYRRFQLKYGPQPGSVQSTGSMAYVTHPANVRSMLMNIGRDPNGYNDANLIGDVRVSKSNIINKGVAWTVTFNSLTNAGDVPMLGAAVDNCGSCSTAVEVAEIQSGRREFGTPEVQVLTILSQSQSTTCAASDLSGFFRLSFNGTQFITHYLKVDSTQSDVENALEQLSTLRDVSVTRSLFNGVSKLSSYKSAPYAHCGYQWTITFTGDKGNQPSITLDASLLVSSHTLVSDVADGDNSLDANFAKNSIASPGEFAVGYNRRFVNADTLSFTIANLKPGSKYYASVSAVNAYGIGAPMLPAGTSVTLPQQAPKPPTAVSLSARPGSATTLDVTYSAPVSDGGDAIDSYRIEVDTSLSFSNPIHTVVNCQPASTHSVFEITTDSGNSAYYIVGGSFKLDVSYNGFTYTTQSIPYNAAADYADEAGILNKVISATPITASLAATASTTVQMSTSIIGIIFKGDRIQFGSDSTGSFVPSTDASHALQVFVVTGIAVNGLSITVNSAVNTLGGVAIPSASVFRMYGGRGTEIASLVSCFAETSSYYTPAWSVSNAVNLQNAYCPTGSAQTNRVQISGSMQSKFELIPDMLSVGVQVDRTSPTSKNGVTWRVTFLDQSKQGALNFGVSLNSKALIVEDSSGTDRSSSGSVTITKLLDGVQYTASCVGTHQIPTIGALVTGQSYYARVFAKNGVGYSLPQTAPTSEKPQIAPGAPTAVTLQVVSDTKLQVIFNTPASDGGDTITSYKVEYSVSSNFQPSSVEYFTLLSGGSPFQKTVSGLIPGMPYFFRVYAGNSQGYGPSTASVPSSLSPHQTPDGPSNVMLRVTSASMLTVSFGEPVNNGGAPIQKYRIEWDTVAGFNSQSVAPNKGFIDVASATANSYTLQYLTTNQQYYVKVSAANSAGFGAATLASPRNAAPVLSPPGRPHTISALTGSSQGTIDLTWQYPRIPWHTIPCGGTIATGIQDCPTEVGGGLPSSTGGSSITEYEINYSESVAFDGLDSGIFTTTATSFTLPNLTPGRLYYIRVLARNAQGSGSYCAFTDANCIVGTNVVKAVAKA